jgi:hypothetical protein
MFSRAGLKAFTRKREMRGLFDYLTVMTETDRRRERERKREGERVRHSPYGSR